MTGHRTFRSRSARLGLAAIVLVLQLAVAACVAPIASAPSSSAEPEAATAPESTEPKQGGELKALLEADAAAGYDPPLFTSRTQWIIGSVIFDGLTEIAPDGTILPGLAESWEVSDDQLTYTFNLREGVKFHNGREMTAEDVKYSLERIKDPETKSPRARNYASVESIEAPDASTVVIQLTEPFAPLLATLAHPTASVLPREEVENGEFAQNPVGTGPFQWVEWARDERIVVEANRDYWKPDRPWLDRIVFTFNLDVNARVAALRSGAVDFLHNVPGELIPLVEQEENLTLYGGEGSMTFWHLWFNTKSGPFSDVRLRQAVLAALDYQGLADAVEPGNSAVLDCGFLPQGHWAQCSDVVWREPDHELAKSLMTEAGFPDGFEFRIMTGSGYATSARLVAAIVEQLKPVGIVATVDMRDSSTVLATAAQGDFDLFPNQFSATFDPDERISQAFVTGGGINYAGYSNPQVDELARQGRQISDNEERGRIYRELQQIVTEEAPIAFVATSYVHDAAHDYVNGYTWSPLFYYKSLRDIWLDK
jgi:peptide/nickel transport system substrate-binding protein